jgi:hypothetical protein
LSARGHGGLDHREIFGIAISLAWSGRDRPSSTVEAGGRATDEAPTPSLVIGIHIGMSGAAALPGCFESKQGFAALPPDFPRATSDPGRDRRNRGRRDRQPHPFDRGSRIELLMGYTIPRKDAETPRRGRLRHPGGVHRGAAAVGSRRVRLQHKPLAILQRAPDVRAEAIDAYEGLRHRPHPRAPTCR